jgi:hypothetical protein
MAFVPAAGASSFFFTLLCPELEDLGGEAFFSPPRVGLLTLAGLAAVPLSVPAALPGLSGPRMARGPVLVEAPPGARPIALSWTSPRPRLSLRIMIRLPSSG